MGHTPVDSVNTAPTFQTVPVAQDHVGQNPAEAAPAVPAPDANVKPKKSSTGTQFKALAGEFWASTKHAASVLADETKKGVQDLRQNGARDAVAIKDQLAALAPKKKEKAAKSADGAAPIAGDDSAQALPHQQQQQQQQQQQPPQQSPPGQFGAQYQQNQPPASDPYGGQGNATSGALVQPLQQQQYQQQYPQQYPQQQQQYPQYSSPGQYQQYQQPAPNQAATEPYTAQPYVHTLPPSPRQANAEPQKQLGAPDSQAAPLPQQPPQPAYNPGVN
jgi:hypothetical protein